ncbi:MAG: hypothetical protein LBO20_11195, partial [Bifidobacteriaceae bacterium]|nr:hypothetical protein [Bifidobacteriaceae bacterium]
QFVRELGPLAPEAARARLRDQGLDQWAAANLVEYLVEQRQATGALPDDRTIVVERFPDELGDTRVMVHSVWGAPVNGAWAAVLSARLQTQFALDAQVMQADDGIMLRLPDNAEDAQLDLLIAPDDVGPEVTAAVTGTGRFAARFREAAARALVLPRRSPERRQPLWQQRHRAQQLLQAASGFSDFPLVMEAIRETLQEDFDLPGLTELMRRIEAREVRVVEVSTPQASPFAGAVAFGYTAQFLYDGDAPLAERRTAALSLDPALLAELLGAGPASDLAELLDPEVVLALDAELARTTPQRRAGNAEALADLLRELGPLGSSRLEQSTAGPWREWAKQLAAARRLIEVRIAGQTRWAVAEDAAALRDGLGVVPPPGLPEALLAPATDPLGALTRRYLRHHGPIEASDLATEFGLGQAVAERELDLLVKRGLARRGRLRPAPAGGRGGADYCDPDVLTRLRRRSLAALRREVEPVEQRVLGAFAPVWQQLGRLKGADGVLAAVTALAGAALPASAVESLVLPSRVVDYSPAALDELITSGEVAWVGEGKGGAGDGTVRLLSLATDDAVLAEAEAPPGGSKAAELLATMRGGGAFWPFELAERLGVDLVGEELRAALWELVWGGWVTADSFAPMRALLAGGKTAHKVVRRPPRARLRPNRAGFARPLGLTGQLGGGGISLAPPVLAARWALAPTPAARLEGVTPERRLAATAQALLERYGVVSRGSAAVETSFAQVYPALSALEESGAIRRGYFVERLGGSQFALPAAPDQLRAVAGRLEDPTGPGVEGPDPGGLATSSGSEPGAVVLAATDPANPYGAALPWPDHAGSHRPGRTAGAAVALVDGYLVFHLERGGRTALSFDDNPGRLTRAAAALGQAVDLGRLGQLKVARLDGKDALAAHARLAPAAQALIEAGFVVTPSGLTRRGRR